MLITISGNVCSGKSSVGKYLEKNYGFTKLEILREDEIKDESRQFSSFHKLDLHVVPKWTRNFYVIVQNIEDAELLGKRPYTLHVYVDAPPLYRYRRFQDKYWPSEEKPNAPIASPSRTLSRIFNGEREWDGRPLEEVDFEDFMEFSESFTYGTSSRRGGLELLRMAHVLISNDCTGIDSLLTRLDEANLVDQERVRPSWNSYFMKLADLAAHRTNCMKRKVGCVIMKDNIVVSTGYNGTPRGMINCNEGGCGRCNDGNGSGTGLSTCLCLHAEENAIMEAGRARTTGATLYCNTCPCLTCSVKIVQSGIKKVVYSRGYSMDEASREVFRQAGVKVKQYIAPKDVLPA